MLKDETDERRKEGLSRAAVGWMTRAEKLREGLGAGSSPSKAPKGCAAAKPKCAQQSEPLMEHPLSHPPSPPSTPSHSGGIHITDTAAAAAAAASAASATAVVVPIAAPVVVRVLPPVAVAPDAAAAPPPAYAADPPPPSFAESLAQLPGGAAAAATLAAEAQSASTLVVDAVVDAVCVAAVTATPTAATLVFDATTSAAAAIAPATATLAMLATASMASDSPPPIGAFECGEHVEYLSRATDRELDRWIAARVTARHSDAPGDAPYYTIALLDGREKQTVPGRLRRAAIPLTGALALAAR